MRTDVIARLRYENPRHLQMIIRHKQPHPAGFGDVEDFLQVLPGAGEVVRVAEQGSAGEQTAW